MKVCPSEKESHMKTIYSIISNSREPGFNLAAEEYLLRTKDQDYNFFYINDTSVIIGKHQNALAEINLPYLDNKGIPLFRRLSGGGTVFHDPGNLNFCFIRNEQPSDLVNFKKATEPIVALLNEWGLPVKHGERNDLLVNFKKISGNACHVFKQRVLHHGTILYDSNLDFLTNSLKVDPTKYADKAVKSVRSEVTNIKDLIKWNKSTEDFMYQLVSSIQQKNSSIVDYSFTQEDIKQIEQIKAEKYDTAEWNFRYGPPYVFKKRSKLGKRVFSIKMKIEKGRIADIAIKTSPEDNVISETIKTRITGLFHDKDEILAALKGIDGYEGNHDELSEIFF